MIFVLQKKCREQNLGLYAAFIDLMKAYETKMPRWALEDLNKAGMHVRSFLQSFSSKDSKDM